MVKWEEIISDGALRLTRYFFNLHLIYEISSLFLNFIFCLFQTGFLQATQAVEIKFEIDKKSSADQQGVRMNVKTKAEKNKKLLHKVFHSMHCASRSDRYV